MRKDDPAERARSVVDDPGIGSELSASPQHDGLLSRLEEDRLPCLLALPAQLFVEQPRPLKVGDSQGDETDALLHASDGTATPCLFAGGWMRWGPAESDGGLTEEP